MMGGQERQREKPNQLKEQKVKSLEFSKPIPTATLAIALAWLLSVRPLLALGPHGYIVRLQQVGPDVVATGSGAIDLTGLTFFQSTSLSPGIDPSKSYLGNCLDCGSTFVNTGPTSSRVDS